MTRPGDVSRRTITRRPAILYGADYNPDQWPDSVVDEDIALMHEASVNVVSLGIFSWARLEPKRDDYHFGWLDSVIERLHLAGISVDLATPTAAPPAWLTHEHPEVLPVGPDGVRLLHGSRRQVCPSSEAYRERARAIAEALGARYGDHPAVIMWHVDNEYACEVAACYCDAALADFRKWLRERYGDLGRLNAAWSTAFWSQAYSAWEEVGPPRPIPGLANPAHHLDWRRFVSDAWLRCFDEQATILRHLAPDVPITTNFMGFFPDLDYFEWAGHEDVVSDDLYPDLFDSDWMVDAAMADDLMRSLGSGRPWVLMEQAPTHVQWRARNATKRPGIMRMRSMQAVARGADAVQFFQWRASLGGSERFHSAMVPHAGRETRTWREVVALGDELGRLADLAGTRSSADVAILYDWDNGWAFEAGGLPSVDLQPLAEARRWYEPFYRRNVLVDIVHPTSDLTTYRLVVAPLIHLVDDAAVSAMRSVVARGGCLILTYFSGIADETTRVIPGAYPAPLRDLLGMAVEEYTAYAAGQELRLDTSDGRSFRSRIWADVIRLEGAEPVATYGEDFIAGSPAITRHASGEGEAWYVGTSLDPAGMSWLVGELCRAANLTTMAWPPDIEVVRRADGSDIWTFVLNHGRDAVVVPIDLPGVDILAGAPVSGSVVVGPTDVAIVRSDGSV